MYIDKKIYDLIEREVRVLSMYNRLSDKGKEKIIALLSMLLTAERMGKDEKEAQDEKL